MPFRFPLESVLHYRRSVEHQQEMLLRLANQHVARMRHLLEQIDRRIADGRGRQSVQLGPGMTAAELHFSLACEAALERQRELTAQDLAHLEALRARQQSVFRQARRERETFESLREREREQYERRASRREQRELDDLFLLRRAYMHKTQARQTPTRHE